MLRARGPAHDGLSRGRMAHPPSTCFGVSSGGTIEILLRNCEISSGIEQAARDLSAQKHRRDVLENCLRELEEDESIDAVGYGGSQHFGRNGAALGWRRRLPMMKTAVTACSEAPMRPPQPRLAPAHAATTNRHEQRSGLKRSA